MFILVALSLFLVLLPLVLVFFLFCPVVLILNSRREEVVLQVRGLASCKLYLVEGSLWVSVNIAFYHKKFDLLERLFIPSKSSPGNNKMKSRSGIPGKMTRRIKNRWRKILFTFKIKQFYVNIDFENNLVTGMLYPIFLLAGVNGLDVHANFTGQREILIEVENRLIRVAKALFF